MNNSDVRQLTLTAQMLDSIRTVSGNGIRRMRHPDSYTSVIAILPMEIKSPFPITLVAGEEGAATSLYIKAPPYGGHNVTIQGGDDNGRGLAIKVASGKSEFDVIQTNSLVVNQAVSLPAIESLTLTGWLQADSYVSTSQLFPLETGGALVLYGQPISTASVATLVLDSVGVTCNAPVFLTEPESGWDTTMAVPKSYVDTQIASTVANYLALDGGTMLGKIILPPTLDIDPANTAVDKSYFSSKLSQLETLVQNTYLPLVGGTVSGKIQTAATTDLDATVTLATKGYVDTQRDKCVFITGSTMTGPLLVPTMDEFSDPKTVVNLEFLYAVMGAAIDNLAILDGRYLKRDGSVPVSGKLQSYATEASDVSTVMTTKGYVDDLFDAALTPSEGDLRYVLVGTSVSQFLSGKLETPVTENTDSIYTLVTRSFLSSSIQNSETYIADHFVPLTGEVVMTGRLFVPQTQADDSPSTTATKSYVDAIKPSVQTISCVPVVTWSTNWAKLAVVTLDQNITLQATGLVDGGTYRLMLIQDATGSRSVTWDSIFKFPGGTAPVLSTAANAYDLFQFVSYNGKLYGMGLRDLK